VTRTIDVCLGDSGRLIGLLRYNQEGPRESASFEYHPEWLAAADRFSLEPGLRLVAGPQFHRKSKEGPVFHAAIADTEPDGWARRVILRDHAKRREQARRGGTTCPRLRGRWTSFWQSTTALRSDGWGTDHVRLGGHHAGG
jgi:serine/threonine-protein kinase HipA